MVKRRFLTAAVLLTFLVSSFTNSYAAKLGDLNGDGATNSIDFGLYRQYLIGGYQIKDKEAADLNGDGNLNSIDFDF